MKPVTILIAPLLLVYCSANARKQINHYILFSHEWERIHEKSFLENSTKRDGITFSAKQQIVCDRCHKCCTTAIFIDTKRNIFNK